MSTSPIDPKIGRCQHCQQIRPVFHHDGKFDNGDDLWDAPYPPYWGTTGAWLCVRDYSAAELARENRATFHVEHELEVWFWRERMGHGPMNARIWTTGGELLTQADQDLKTCEEIWAASQAADEPA